MLQFYEVRLGFRATDGKMEPITKNVNKTILIEQNELELEKKKYHVPDITWKNISYAWKYCIWGHFDFPFYCRGEEVEIPDEDSWSCDGIILTPKKNPNMKIACLTKIVPIQLSINEIMAWPEGDKAIKYLVERGLGVNAL